jgi:hypothetical protein
MSRHYRELVFAIQSLSSTAFQSNAAKVRIGFLELPMVSCLLRKCCSLDTYEVMQEVITFQNPTTRDLALNPMQLDHETPRHIMSDFLVSHTQRTAIDREAC